MKRWIAVALLALAGCSNAPLEPQVPQAAAPTGSPTAPVAKATQETDYDKALRYARCMNENGAKIADPEVGKPLEMGVPRGTGQPNRSQVVPEAFHKCKHFMPATWPVKMDPADIARERAFGECLRLRGVYWPEPDNSGMMAYNSNPESHSSPEYQAAEAACRHLYDDPANNAGQG